jgi:ferredoxin-NADP reductase
MAIITGGSGISYLLSFLSSNWEGEIVGVWSVRGRQAFEEFLPLLEEGIDRRRSLGLRTRIRVYCTGYSYLSPVVLPDAIDVVPERADYAHLLSEEGEEGMGVVACGPKGMVNDVKDVWKGRFWGEEYSL